MLEKRSTASTGRKILSWFVDYLFFAVAWTLLTYVSGQILRGGDFLFSLFVFFLLRGILGRFGSTPGRMLLSIDSAGDVDPIIKSRESWLTMLLGVLFLLSGTKLLVRWTQIDAVWPYFGDVPGPAMHVAISILLGLAAVAAGGLILKMTRAGQILGVLVCGVHIVSAVLSWSLWDGLVEKQVHARRAFQGGPVRPGEVEFMQALFPEALIALSVLLIVFLLFPTRRFGA